MATKVEICNMAIAHLGAGKPISNIDTERSAEASACRLFFDIARDATLREFKWPFATSIVALQEIEEAPSTEWSYSYQYPNTCLFFRRILSGTRIDTQDTRVPYKVVQDDARTVIYTDQPEAEAEITLKQTNPAIFPPDFVLALSYRLASYIAPSVGGSEGKKLRAEMLQLYSSELGQAQANAYNEEVSEQMPDAETIRARQ